MGHSYDFLEAIRYKFARVIGGFVTGVERVRTSPAEFVGYVEMSEEDFESHLHEMGFYRNSLAYWKYFPGLGQEEGSWRWLEGDWQLHVMLYDGHPEQDASDDAEPKTYVFAHWEYRWDRHPFKHLRGVDQSDPKGVNRMRTMLNENSIPFYNDVSIQ